MLTVTLNSYASFDTQARAGPTSGPNDWWQLVLPSVAPFLYDSEASNHRDPCTGRGTGPSWRIRGLRQFMSVTNTTTGGRHGARIRDDRTIAGVHRRL